MEAAFKRVMNASKEIMGKYAFRRLREDGRRNSINKAIYEAWCRSLFFLKDSELDVLKQQRAVVYERFLKLCGDSDFLQMVKSGDKKSFLMRFTFIDQMLKEVLHDTKD